MSVDTLKKWMLSNFGRDHWLIKLLRKPYLVYKARGRQGVFRSRVAYQEADLLYREWRIDEALARAQQSALLDPTFSASHSLLSILQELKGDKVSALASAAKANLLNPFDRRAVRQLRKLAPRHHRFNFVSSIKVALLASGYRHKPVISAMRVMLDLGLHDDALAILDACSPTSVYDREELALFRAKVLLDAQRWGEAHESLQQCIGSDPFSDEARLLKVRLLFEKGDLEAASAALAEAERFAAASGRTVPFNLHEMLLKFATGRMRDAWDDYRRRPVSGAMTRLFAQTYNPSLATDQTAREVLLIAEGGVGDEIRLASVYPDLAGMFDRLTITCEPRLKSLLERSFPQVAFISCPRWRSDFSPVEPELRSEAGDWLIANIMNNAAVHQARSADAFCSVMDVLRDLRQRPDDFPSERQYLFADPVAVGEWQQVVAGFSRQGKKQVAISWRSLLKGPNRDIHYLQAKDLAPLAHVDADYWLFQTAIEEDEFSALASLLPNVRTIPGLDLKDDFEGQAAFLSCMDAVVAPCNTTAELAGSLGVTTLFFGRTEGAKWRIRPDGTDIWHPSVKSVLGNPLGDRKATAEAIADELARMLA